MPLLNRVLVQKAVAPTKSAGGILLPTNTKPSFIEGTVVAVGEGLRVEGKLVPPVVKAGDKVLLPEFGGSKLEMDGQDYHLFHEEDILAVVKQ